MPYFLGFVRPEVGGQGVGEGGGVERGKVEGKEYCYRLLQDDLLNAKSLASFFFSFFPFFFL